MSSGVPTDPPICWATLTVAEAIPASWALAPVVPALIAGAMVALIPIPKSNGGPERSLMAIDPKACVADPCFDAVDYVVAGAGLEGVETRCARVRCGCPGCACGRIGPAQVRTA
ncbi:hypothetical protein GCM10009579_66630 [Streptomyces javensis]|uniref:Uncharacterized protein n=1 Tax=Streptomyces javensis TaxID=114698 RepID=A0ABN1X8U8_9ACTN